MKTPPPRLLEDPTALPELRDDLRRAAAAEYPYDSAAGLASLQAALLITPASTAGSAGAAAHGGGAATTATGLGATKITIAALATAISLGTVATIAWPKHPSGDGPAKTVVHDQPAAAPAAPVAAPAPEPAPVAAPAPVAPAATAPAALPEAKLPSDPDGRLRREIAQLARIKALLPAQPRAALQLAQAGNREFARGMLVQEREGIAVLALAQLGRQREASARAQSFLTRFPDSPLRERIALIAAGSGATQ